MRSDGWVIDGTYPRKLGSLVLDSADTVVWLDQPVRVWLPRLLRRTARRVTGRETLWNGNRETLWTAVGGRESLFCYALRPTSAGAGRGPRGWRATPSPACGPRPTSSAGSRMPECSPARRSPTT